MRDIEKEDLLMKVKSTHSYRINNFLLSNNKKYLYITSSDYYIRKYNTSQFEMLFSYKHSQNLFKMIELNEDHFLIGSCNGKIISLNLKSSLIENIYDSFTDINKSDWISNLQLISGLSNDNKSYIINQDIADEEDMFISENMSNTNAYKYLKFISLHYYANKYIIWKFLNTKHHTNRLNNEDHESKLESKEISNTELDNFRIVYISGNLEASPRNSDFLTSKIIYISTQNQNILLIDAVTYKIINKINSFSFYLKKIDNENLYISLNTNISKILLSIVRLNQKNEFDCLFKYENFVSHNSEDEVFNFERIGENRFIINSWNEEYAYSIRLCNKNKV